jgi:hypothetical protein
MCGDCFEYLLDGLKHTCVDAPLVLIRQISELAGKRKRYQIIGHRQKLCSLCINPLLTFMAPAIQGYPVCSRRWPWLLLDFGGQLLYSAVLVGFGIPERDC